MNTSIVLTQSRIKTQKVKKSFSIAKSFDNWITKVSKFIFGDNYKSPFKM